MGRGGAVNYLAGSDPTGWITGVPHYARVCFEKVYPGIDMVYHETEFDFIVAPGADAGRILLEFPDAQELTLSDRGDLLIRSAGQVFTAQRPVAYQEVDGHKIFREATQRITDRTHVAFSLGVYDHSSELVIDPVLSYSAVLPGSLATLDSNGSVYIVGGSTNGPPPPGSFSGGCGTVFCAGLFVMKLSAASGSLEYLTYIAKNPAIIGSTPLLAVDGTGSLYLAGYTSATDFPVTTGPKPDSSPHPFVLKLNPSGTALTYATLLPAVPQITALAVDSAGAVYLGGAAGPGLATTTNAMIPKHNGSGCVTPFGVAFTCLHAFGAKLNPTGTSLDYVTYLGQGRNWAESTVQAITVDSMGNAYFGGWSSAGSVSPTSGALAPDCPSQPFGYVYLDYANAFILKLGPKGSSAQYTSVFGCDAGVSGLALDSGGNLHVAGNPTGALWSGYVLYLSIPVTANAFQKTTDNSCNFGTCGGFLAELNPSGSAFVYATYLASGVNGLGIDSAGDAWVGGSTYSATLPVTPDALQATKGLLSDAYVVKLNPSGSSMLYGTYLGDGGVTSSSQNDDYTIGVFASQKGDVFVIGNTESADFPVWNAPALPDGPLSQFQLFITRFTEGTPPPRPSIPPNGVVNAASMLPAAVAGGEIVSIFGTGLGPQAPAGLHMTRSGTIDTSTGGARVVVNGNPIPILFAQMGQVNAILPMALAPPITLQVEFQGQKSALLRLNPGASPPGNASLTSSPGLFTTRGTGVGQGAILNQDNTANSPSNPAAIGSIVSLYGTGAGPLNGYPPAGSIASVPLPKPQLPVSVAIGGVGAQVTYAGTSAGLSVGVLQVNVQIPAGAPVGAAVPVVLTVGPSSSQAGVTMAIH
jgi:uncharacterized protein (TIGR03437 family)